MLQTEDSAERNEINIKGTVGLCFLIFKSTVVLIAGFLLYYSFIASGNWARDNVALFDS